LIRRHNTIVDIANTYSGCSVLQAVKHAQDNTPVVKVNHRVDSRTFLVYDNIDLVKLACEKLYGPRTFRKPDTINGFYVTSLNGPVAIQSLLETINRFSGAYGTQPPDKDGEDITKRKHKDVKIKSGEHSGKFGILLDKTCEEVEGQNIVKYNININYDFDKWEVNSFKREEFSLITHRAFYPCYKNPEDQSTRHFVVKIRPGTDLALLADFKTHYPSINIPQEGEF
jgi:hypothetical protein